VPRMRAALPRRTPRAWRPPRADRVRCAQRDEDARGANPVPERHRGLIGMPNLALSAQAIRRMATP